MLKPVCSLLTSSSIAHNFCLGDGTGTNIATKETVVTDTEKDLRHAQLKSESGGEMKSLIRQLLPDS